MSEPPDADRPPGLGSGRPIEVETLARTTDPEDRNTVLNELGMAASVAADEYAAVQLVEHRHHVHPAA